MAYNIAHSLSEVAVRKGSATGLIEAATEKQLTFTQLESRTNAYASYLRRNGVSPGDRVMLMVKPGAEFICLTFALFKIGAPVILIDPGMGYKNLLRCVKNVQPKILLGIPQALVFTRLFKGSFSSLQKRFCCGNSFGFLGKNISTIKASPTASYPVYSPTDTDLAAIIFTTGSTGPPKGVRYEHSIFAAQLDHIRNYYRIGVGDIDQPAFPLFALFSIALGACAVIPDMDATKPAEVNPATYCESLMKYNVSYSFGSPALWNVISSYCLNNNKKLGKLKKVLMAGAPVSGELVSRVQQILPEEAEIHTPYGATECLPIVSIEGKEIVRDTWFFTKKGSGTCVGKPLPGIEIRIIQITEDILPELRENMLLVTGEIGEIIVSGDVVTRSYDNNGQETRQAKTLFEGKMWHRMGDTGYLDTSGRLWFCGRKAHRVRIAKGTKFTIQVEALFNNHPDIFRSALVGIPTKNAFQTPVILLEITKNCRRNPRDIIQEIREIASQSEMTNDISHFLIHPKFPVDIRHNAKIFREKLAVWAEGKIASS